MNKTYKFGETPEEAKPVNDDTSVKQDHAVPVTSDKAPKGYEQEAWEQAAKATDDLSGTAGTDAKDRERRIKERYYQIVKSNEETRKWETGEA